MDRLSSLTRETRIVLGTALLCFIFSFLNWEQVSIPVLHVTAGISEWHSVGVIAALLVIALLVWEGARQFQPQIQVGGVSPALVSVGLSLAFTLFTIIAFLHFSTDRHWPAWVALILSIALAAAAVRRAQAEGVPMPQPRART